MYPEVKFIDLTAPQKAQSFQLLFEISQHLQDGLVKKLVAPLWITLHDLIVIPLPFPKYHLFTIKNAVFSIILLVELCELFVAVDSKSCLKLLFQNFKHIEKHDVIIQKYYIITGALVQTI